MEIKKAIERMLRAEEGYRDRPYDDKAGVPIFAPVGKLTIGVGHNLQDKPLTPEAIAFILNEDINDVLVEALTLFPELETWKEGRQLAIINMIFQLGISGFLEFRKSIEAIRKLDWDEAAKEVLKSKWAEKDSPARAIRISEMLRTGQHFYEVNL